MPGGGIGTITIITVPVLLLYYYYVTGQNKIHKNSLLKLSCSKKNWIIEYILQS